MELGFVGLGKMGANMVRRLIERGGHELVVFDRDPSALARAREVGAKTASSLEQLVSMLRPPRTVWMMVPAGAAVDETLGQLLKLGAPGDVFVDGGNSHFKDSIRRSGLCRAEGREFVDAGTSGGIWGLTEGYCLMVGASPEAFARLEPALRTLAPERGYAHLGPPGAGHYAKMVHNGVEYALMQAYAEGFALLEGSGFGYDLPALAGLWQRGSVVRSWLLELTARALSTDPKLKDVAAYVEDTGEGRWTVESAIEQAVPTPVIAQALFARFRSRQPSNFADRVVAILRKQFGGHATRPAAETTKEGA